MTGADIPRGGFRGRMFGRGFVLEHAYGPAGGNFTTLPTKYRRGRVSGSINFASESHAFQNHTYSSGGDGESYIRALSSLRDRGALQSDLQIRICLRNDGAVKGLNQSHRQCCRRQKR